MAVTAQHRIIEKIAEKGSCVIVERAADHVLRDHPDVVRIFLYAPAAYRIRRVMEIYGDSETEAAENIRRSDKARAAYYKGITGSQWGDRHHYDLMIDSSIGLAESAELIVNYLEKRQNKTDALI